MVFIFQKYAWESACTGMSLIPAQLLKYKVVAVSEHVLHSRLRHTTKAVQIVQSFVDWMEIEHATRDRIELPQPPK